MTEPLFPSGPREIEVMRMQFEEEVIRLKKNVATPLQNLGVPGFCGSKGNGCGQEIWWVKTRAGKAAPMNADGASHFGTCEFARNFRKGATA